MSEKLVVFDGYCNLCRGLVKFLIKRDKRRSLIFIPSGSDKGKFFINKFKITIPVNEIIYIEKNKVFIRSEAIFRIVLNLSWFWQLTYVLRVIPVKLRDVIYLFISRNRYRWFGKSNTCFIPYDKEP